MFRWIGRELELGRREAQRQGEVCIVEFIRRSIRAQKALDYRKLLSLTIHRYSKEEIDLALMHLVDAGEIRREGQVFHAAA